MSMLDFHGPSRQTPSYAAAQQHGAKATVATPVGHQFSPYDFNGEWQVAIALTCSALRAFS